MSEIVITCNEEGIQDIYVDERRYVPEFPRVQFEVGDIVQLRDDLAREPREVGPDAGQIGIVNHVKEDYMDVDFGGRGSKSNGCGVWSFSLDGDESLTFNPAISLLTKISHVI